MTQTNKTQRAARLRGVGIEGSMSRSIALGADDPRHRIAADRELDFLQRYKPEDFAIDDEQRVTGTGSFLNHIDTPPRYLGSELFYLRVKADGSGVEFAPISGGSAGGDPGAGGIAGVLTVTSLNSDTTITTSDTVLLCNAVTGAFMVTLPTAVGNNGKRYDIKKTDPSANTVTVDADGEEVIDGATTAVLTAQHESITIVASRGSWFIL